MRKVRDNDTITSRVQLNFLNETVDGNEGGIPEFGEFTVRQCLVGGRDGVRTYEFEALKVGDTVYKRVSQPRSDPAPFDQWAYLVCPEAFSEAVAQTAWAKLRYLRQTRVVGRDDEGGGRLIWRLVVNYPMALASWSGFRMHRREFMLHFTVDGGEGRQQGQDEEGEKDKDPPPPPPPSQPAPAASGKKRRHRRGGGGGGREGD